MWQVFPDTSLALTKCSPRTLNKDKLESAKKSIQKLLFTLRDHDAFSSTTLAVLANRWGVINPPDSQVFPNIWLINFCDYLNTVEVSGKTFEHSLELYLSQIQKEKYSFTDWIFRSMPEKKIVWIRRDKRINNVQFSYLLKDYIIQIKIPDKPCFNVDNPEFGKDHINQHEKWAINNKYIEEYSDKTRFLSLPLGELLSCKDIKLDLKINSQDVNTIKRLIQLLEQTDKLTKEQEKRAESILKVLELHKIISTWTDIIYIPSSGNTIENPDQTNKSSQNDLKESAEGSGGLILFEKLPENASQITNNWFRWTLDRVKYTHSSVQQFYSYFIRQDQEERYIYHARRAAMGAIMSRNMSHNIGSHVTPRTSVELIRGKLDRLNDFRILDIAKNLRHTLNGFIKGKDKRCKEQGVKIINILKNIENKWREWTKEEKKENINKLIININRVGDWGDLHDSPIEEIKKIILLSSSSQDLSIIGSLKLRLDEYVQKKADFLAEITTEPLSSTKPVSFYRDVIRPFVENTLLMDTIAANEGVGYIDLCTNRLQILVNINNSPMELKYSKDKSEEISPKRDYRYPSELPYSLCDIETNEPLTAIVNKKRNVNDLEVELPGPLGEFAFYGLIENYIRNVAKHNRRRLEKEKTKSLDINIDIKDHSINHYQVELSSNFSMWKKSIADDIQNYINGEIIDQEGRLTREAWGIGEMKICATLLRGSKNFSSENMVESLKILKRGNQLIHQFYIMKPKKICAVIPKWDNAEKLIDFKTKGIWIFTSIAELKRQFNEASNRLGKDQKLYESIASFQFALFHYDSIKNNETDLINILEKLPFRIVIYGCPQNNRGIVELKGKLNELFISRRILVVSEQVDFNQSCSKIMAQCWSVWLKRWLGKTNTSNVVVYLGQNSKEEPTKSWLKHAKSFALQSTNVNLFVYNQSEYDKNIALVKSRSLNVFYDRHLQGLKKYQINNKWEHNFLGKDSYIFFDKKSSDFISLFSPIFPSVSNDSWLFPYQLAEAGLLRVLVIDERVAEAATKRVPTTDQGKDIKEEVGADDSSLPPFRWNLALAPKIFICTHLVLDGNTSILHPSVESSAFTRRLELILKTQNKSPDMNEVKSLELKIRIKSNGKYYSLNQIDLLIIHQGILERDEIKDVIQQEKFLESLRKYIPFVIVDSGRGIPPNLSKASKFLPFSLLQDFLMSDRIAKISLTQVAMSLTRMKNSEV